MVILCLSKRRPQGRDLYTHPYGRFYYLPRLLADHGHQVHLLILNYRNEPPAQRNDGNLHWHSISLFPSGPKPFLINATQFAMDLKPDWIMGFSDTWYGILAERLGRKHQIFSLVDAYDNYESYIPWCKPLHWAWRRSVSRATVVTAAGPGLAEFLSRKQPGRPAHVIPMAADPEFVPMDKTICRRALDLPMDKKLVGYCGSLHPSRGLDTLFKAFEIVKKKNGNTELILTGRRWKSVSLPTYAKWLGYLPNEKVPLFVNSMDVLTVINRPTSFGNHSYPVKLYEAMSCGVPAVATRTPATEWILQDNQQLLCRPEDHIDLGGKIQNALDEKQVDYGPQPRWKEIAQQMNELLMQDEFKLPFFNSVYQSRINKS